MENKYPRPSPDRLLSHIAADDASKKLGKLKIFLGYAAGVGKTYAMLESAQRIKGKTDVVVAYVETHGRAETEALLGGLETIARKQVEYRGLPIPEMDLDAVLARKPKLALVDELAHTNAPGSRHPKRYQDVEELLEAGIDVYTTLNIQHLESLRESVSRITNVWVRETIPDTIIDQAAEIELIDLPPDDLLERLNEGKVYVTEQIAHAMANFFRKGNLSALRELSMRTAAQRVDNQVKDYMETHIIRGPWPTAERLLVCITPGSLGNRLIHTARSLAYQLDASWTAVHVETPGSTDLSDEQQEQLTTLMRQAEKLGAQVEILQGLSVSRAILEYAYTNNITKIILGKPRNVHLRRLLSQSVANQIVRHSKFVDVYIVSGKGIPLEQNILPARASPIDWPDYLWSLAAVTIISAIGNLFRPLFHPVNIVMLYLMAVVASAVFFGFGPSIATAIIGLLAFDFLFIPPYFTFAVAEPHYIFTFAILLIVGIVISYLTHRMRRHTSLAQIREHETSTLYSLSKMLSSSLSSEATISSIQQSARERFDQQAVVFIPSEITRDGLVPFYDKSASMSADNELAVATWVYQHQKPAGRNTDTLPNVNGFYLPLTTLQGIVGVIGLYPLDISKQPSVQQMRLLRAFVDLSAVALERAHLAEAVNAAKVLEASSKLQSTLLNSISHDLRTPLVSIIGVLSSLQEENVHLDETSKNNMVQVAREEAERLNHLITNLLDVSRLEAGALHLSIQPADIQDLIGTALEQIGGRYDNPNISVALPKNLPLIDLDFSLITQVLVNVLDNALKYSGQKPIVEVSVKSGDHNINIEIMDRGMGIPEQDLSRVFDKFYRVQNPDGVAGTGLGLSICKGIIEAHHGTIIADRRPGGGTIIRISIPYSSAESGVK